MKKQIDEFWQESGCLNFQPGSAAKRHCDPGPFPVLGLSFPTVRGEGGSPLLWCRSYWPTGSSGLPEKPLFPSSPKVQFHLLLWALDETASSLASHPAPAKVTCLVFQLPMHFNERSLCSSTLLVVVVIIINILWSSMLKFLISAWAFNSLMYLIVLNMVASTQQVFIKCLVGQWISDGTDWINEWICA